MTGPIYLDHHATTPVDPRVLERMVTVLRDQFGNPASSGHAYGWAANALVDAAREEVAALVGATAREIVFTSGATESCNLALTGLAQAAEPAGRHIVTTNLEHPAVSAPLARLADAGWTVTTVAADTHGLVDPQAVVAALTDTTVLVAVIAAQNEIGTLQPVREIATACRARGTRLFVDGAQAVGKVPLDVQADGIDLLAFSAHKIYGPKGVGALFVRRRDPRVSLVPQIVGGGQERGLRSGTLNVPGIVAFGEACRLARLEREVEASRLRTLRDRLWKRLRDGITDLRLNGDARRRLPGNLHVSVPGLPPGRLLPALTRLAVSAGAACSSDTPETSPILAALGVDPALARNSLRLGLGRFTTEAEVDEAAAVIVAAVTTLRREAC